tara:strand:- start:2151 stop:2384 length:234 start_codon:yes stop_codon:yes gene_type:complete
MSYWEKGKQFAETHVIPYTIIYLSTFVTTMIVSGIFFIQEFGLEPGLAAAYVFTKALTPIRMATAIIGTYYYVQTFQ